MDNHNRNNSDTAAPATAAPPSNSNFNYGSLQTYTAGEDSSRLATLAKEFGLSRQRLPRPQIRLRVPEYALENLNLSSLKNIYGRMKSFDNEFEEMRLSASLGTPRENDDDDDEKRLLLLREDSSMVGLLLTRLPSLDEFEDDEPPTPATKKSSSAQSPPVNEDPHAAGLGGTLSSATLGIIKGMVGPAILYLPHGFAGAGYLVAIPMLLLSTSLFLWSSGCLLECWKMEMLSRQQQQQHHHQRQIALSYPELAYRAWGIKGQRLVQIGITLMQSGVCLTYLIFVPQNLRTSALLLLNVDISTTVWLLLMVIVQIPLSWIRDIRRLTVTNLLANVLILFGLLSCLGLVMRQMGESGSVGDESTSFLEEMVHRAKSLPAFNPDGWFLFLGTSVLLFEGSITLLVPLIEAVNTPEDKQKFPSMYRAVIIGIVSFYAFFGTVCWMAIGDSVRTVMTTSLPQGMLATMIQLAYSLAVIFTFPLQNFPSLEIVCASVEKILPKRRNDGKSSSSKMMLKGSYGDISNGQRNIISSMVVVSLSIVAVLAMDDLDKVVSIMGGLFGCPLAFVFPPLIENELGKGKIGSQKWIVNLAVATLGVGAMFVSTLTTLINWN